MGNPEIPKKGSYTIDVKSGETYYWCSCGKSKKQPFCDGSHKGTEFKPLPYKAEKDGIVHFCGCKHTKNPPLCDGEHRKL